MFTFYVRFSILDVQPVEKICTEFTMKHKSWVHVNISMAMFINTDYIYLLPRVLTRGDI